ncbi:MAG TPA: heavy metal translocating P-type ATPase, partial [Blastocatellia bacterium]|nr:heavy metal translocating P-type ATPase [Blastocatellia bacterium]
MKAMQKRSKNDEACERVDLPITGMTCAACASRIERTLNRQPGVKAASVNFATERATVTFDPAAIDAQKLIGSVRDAGYDVAAETEDGSVEESLEAAHAAEYAELKRKFIVAAVFSLPVLVIAMSHGTIEILDFRGVNWLQFVLTTPVVFYSGIQFYRGAWAAFRHRAADM